MNLNKEKWNGISVSALKRYLKERYKCPIKARLWKDYTTFVYDPKTPKPLSAENVSGFVFLVCMETKAKGFTGFLNFDKSHKNPLAEVNDLADYTILVNKLPKQVTLYLKTELRFVNVKGKELLPRNKYPQETDKEFQTRLLDKCVQRVEEYVQKQRKNRDKRIKEMNKLLNDHTRYLVYQSLLKGNHRTGKSTQYQLQEIYKFHNKIKKLGKTLEYEYYTRTDILRDDLEKKKSTLK